MPLSLALSVTTGGLVISQSSSPPIEKGVPHPGGRRRRRPYLLDQYLSHRFAKEQPSIPKGKEVSRGGKP